MSRSLLILHLGQHKTGTTAAQWYFADRRKALLRAGVRYPAIGEINHQHAAIPAAFLSTHPFIAAHQRGADPRELIDELADTASPGAVTLMSSEVWSELLRLKPQEFDSAIGLLERRFDLIPVMVIRDPWDKAWSSVKHLARVGIPMRLAGMIRGEQSADQRSIAHLRERLPKTRFLTYDATDAVGQLLDVAYTEMPQGSRWLVPRRRLRGLIAAHRQGRSTPQRLNSAPADPRAASVPLLTSQLLAEAPDRGPREDRQGLYADLIRRTVRGPLVAALPTEAEIRVQTEERAEVSLDELLADSPPGSLTSFWRSAEVTDTCRAHGALDLQSAILSACRERTPLV